MLINGETEIYGIFGYPVKHSKSPVFQNPAFSFYNLNSVYIPFEVEPSKLEEGIKSLKVLNIKGINITIPHKEEAVKYLDELSEEVKYIKAVNTVKNIDGYLIGYNTDAYGFITGLKEIEKDLTEKNILVIGAGGASRGVIYSLIKEGINKIFLANRTLERAKKIVEDFKALNRFIEDIIEIIPQKDIEKFINKSDIIVNTTPVGLREGDSWLFDYNLLKEKHTVVDIVYKKTPLIEIAIKKGCKWQDGYPMLLYQGAKSFEIWTGRKAPIDIMKKALGLL